MAWHGREGMECIHPTTLPLLLKLALAYYVLTCLLTSLWKLTSTCSFTYYTPASFAF